MTNPYWGANFLQFFGVLGQRLFSLLKGEKLALAPDEVQILVLGGVAVSCGLIGSFLLVRKMTMVANSLSHTLLLGIVFSTLIFSGKLGITTLLVSAFITALMTVGLSYLLSKSPFVKEDAGVGLSFTTLFALGLIALMLFAKNTHIGVEVVMGNLDAVHIDDIYFSWAIAIIDGLLLFLFYPWLKAHSFDSTFSFSLRLPCKSLDLLFLLLVSLTCVGAFRSVGVLIVLAFLTGPALCGKIFCHRLGRILLVAVGLGLLITLLSVAIARHILSVHHIPLSTAGIAAVLIGLFVLFALASTARRMLLSVSK
jgi:manganese/zinc/iron transport system permease protein